MLTSNPGEAVILPEDPRAATPREDLKVWAAGGKFYTDEAVARRVGATHVRCNECREVFRKSYPNDITCPSCCSARRRKAWLALPVEDEYDGGMCFDFDRDEAFDSEDEVLEWCLENDVLPGDMMLLGSEPHYVSQIDEDYLVGDECPEDYSLKKSLPDVYEALEKLNDVIGHENHVMWYVPSRKRIVLETPPDWEGEARE